MRIPKISLVINKKYSKTNNQNTTENHSYTNNVSFQGGSKFFDPLKKLFKPFANMIKSVDDKVSDFIAKGIVKIIDKKFVQKIVEKAKKIKKLTACLLTLTSFVLSGFYIKRTLDNEKLEERKRKTLAINQAGVTILSAIGAFAIEGAVSNKVKEVTNKFAAVNFKNTDPKLLSKYKAGFSAAKSIIIFGTIYRFISPVLVTPIANKIGNKVNAKKAEKKSA